MINISIKNGRAIWRFRASRAANRSEPGITCKPIELQQAWAKGHVRKRCPTVSSSWQERTTTQGTTIIIKMYCSSSQHLSCIQSVFQKQLEEDLVFELTIGLTKPFKRGMIISLTYHNSSRLCLPKAVFVVENTGFPTHWLILSKCHIQPSHPLSFIVSLFVLCSYFYFLLSDLRILIGLCVLLEMVGIKTQGLLFKTVYVKKNKDEWLCECKMSLEELGYLGSKIQKDALNGPKRWNYWIYPTTSVWSFTRTIVSLILGMEE